MNSLRIRQLVFASNDHDDIEKLRHVLGLGAEFVDPGVDIFGLTNGVFALGDQFLEVVVPTQPDTAAGRFMARSGGIGGYMAIFQVDDLKRARDTVDALGLRRVWNIDQPDIAASHLHPADIGAAIVSVDQATPAASWRWGGPHWTENAVPGGLIQLDVAAISPRDMSTRWGKILGVPAVNTGAETYEIKTQDGPICFSPGDRDHLRSYTLALPEMDGCLARAAALGWHVDSDAFEFAGVTLRLTAIDPLA